jgi:hypothetical protein
VINTPFASHQPPRTGSSAAPASAVSRRWWRGIAGLVVVLGALIVPSAAIARPFSSTLQAPTHRPHVGLERIRVTASHNGRGLCGKVSYVFYWNGQKVNHQPGGRFCRGVWRDTLRWPSRAVGYRLTLGVVVNTRYGTDYDWWWIQVRR